MRRKVAQSYSCDKQCVTPQQVKAAATTGGQQLAGGRIIDRNDTRSWKVTLMIALAGDFRLRIGVRNQTRRHPLEILLAGKKRTTPAMAPTAG